MDGFLANILKYLLFFVNFVLFISGCVVFGVAIWVLVDSPKFMELFEKTKDVVSDEVDTSDLELNIYSTAVYVFLALSAFFVIVSFFGCCGAWRESRCMLGTYFTFILILFICLIVGAVLAYKGNLKNKLETPLYKSVAMYKDNPDEKTESKGLALKQAWNTVQNELKCCGVGNASDWLNATEAGWSPDKANKPKGCCMWKVGVDGSAMDISQDQTAVQTCRESVVSRTSSELSKVYYFDGCFAKFEDQVKKNREVVIWATVGAALILVVTLLVALALCMMAD